MFHKSKKRNKLIKKFITYEKRNLEMIRVPMKAEKAALLAHQIFKETPVLKDNNQTLTYQINLKLRKIGGWSQILNEHSRMKIKSKKIFLKATFKKKYNPENQNTLFSL